MRFEPDPVHQCRSKNQHTSGMFCDQRFIEFCVITVDIVEKPNLIFLVHRRRAADNQNRNSRDQSAERV
jgi:hypothetical protein